MGDDDLVTKAAHGDETAFLVVWDRHRDAVHRFAAWTLGEPSGAEDITHDVFVALIEHPHRFDPKAGSLRTFLFAIARNLCHKRIRKLRPEVDLEFDGESTEIGVLDRLMNAEASAALRDALVFLPTLQREVLFLFEFEELSMADVATVLNIDVNAVKARLHRARQRLRRELAWMKI